MDNIEFNYFHHTLMNFNTLSTFISKIRKKLGSGWRKKYSQLSKYNNCNSKNT